MKKLIIALFCIVLLTGCGGIEKSLLKNFPMDRVKSFDIGYQYSETNPLWCLDMCLRQEFNGICATGQGPTLEAAFRDTHLKLGL